MKQLIILTFCFSAYCKEIPLNTRSIIHRLQTPSFTFSLNPADGTEAEQVAREDKKVIRFLNSIKTADLYHTDIIQGPLPVMTACAFNHPTIVRYLVERGLPPIDTEERAVLVESVRIASKKGNFATIMPLFWHLTTEEITHSSDESDSLFLEAFSARNDTALYRMLRADIPFQYLNKIREGNTLLHRAIKNISADKKTNESYDAIGALLVIYSGIHGRIKRDSSYRTPLQLARERKEFRPETFRALLLLTDRANRNYNLEKLCTEVKRKYER